MDNKSTTKRMIGAVVLVLIAALLLAWLLKGKNRSVQEQELIAQQTQTAEPILGFPGVNQDGQNVDGAAAQQLADTGQAAQQEPTAQEAPYTMGADSQQQAPDAGTATVAGGEGKAAAGTDEGSMVAGRTDESTGFQIRDSGSKTEQRVIVENGEIKAGTGSMGSGSEVVAADAGKTDGTGTVEQAVADDVAQAARTAEAAVVEEAAKAEAAVESEAGQQVAATRQEPQLAPSEKIVADTGSTGSSSGRTTNPTLVNEKPVPAPRTQTAASSRSSTSSASSGSTSVSSGSAASASTADSAAAVADSGSGYAIQVLAASSASKAETVRKSIAEDGYPTFVVKASVNGKTVYRVRIGSYPQRNAAVAVQNRLKARYTRNQYVQNSFVTRNN